MTTVSIPLSARQRHILAEMGIDVWIRRSSVEPSAVVAEPEPEADPEAAKVRPIPALPAVEPAPQGAGKSTVLRVALDCLAAPGAIVIGRFASPHDQRLARDIALAVGGASGDLKRTHFRWPQTRTGDSSAAAARNAYRGFLRGQIDRTSARWVLLLGNDAQVLLDADADIETPRLLRLPDASALRADPLGKKRLWLSVSAHDPS